MALINNEVKTRIYLLDHNETPEDAISADNPINSSGQKERLSSLDNNTLVLFVTSDSENIELKNLYRDLYVKTNNEFILLSGFSRFFHTDETINANELASDSHNGLMSAEQFSHLNILCKSLNPDEAKSEFEKIEKSINEIKTNMETNFNTINNEISTIKNELTINNIIESLNTDTQFKGLIEKLLNEKIDSLTNLVINHKHDSKDLQSDNSSNMKN